MKLIAFSRIILIKFTALLSIVSAKPGNEESNMGKSDSARMEGPGPHNIDANFETGRFNILEKDLIDIESILKDMESLNDIMIRSSMYDKAKNKNGKEGYSRRVGNDKTPSIETKRCTLSTDMIQNLTKDSLSGVKVMIVTVVRRDGSKKIIKFLNDQKKDTGDGDSGSGAMAHPKEKLSLLELKSIGRRFEVSKSGNFKYPSGRLQYSFDRKTIALTKAIEAVEAIGPSSEDDERIGRVISSSTMTMDKIVAMTGLTKQWICAFWIALNGNKKPSYPVWSHYRPYTNTLSA